MGGDYTRFTHRPQRDYSGVLMQQGRVQLDSDWNEAQAIADRRLRAETIDVMGATAVPETTPDAFKIEIDPDQPRTFKIGRGRMYVDGLLVECHGASGLPKVSTSTDSDKFPDLDNIPGLGLFEPPDIKLSPVEGETGVQVAEKESPQPTKSPSKSPIWVEAPQTYDPQLGEMYGTAPIPYENQPYYYPTPLPLSQEPGKTNLVYLKVWQREVTAIADPEIKEIALGGADTATRIQTAWQVKVLPLDGGGKSYSCGSEIPHWKDETAPSGGHLSTSVVTPPASDNPCDLPPVGGYRGLENRLYRVEIHQGAENKGQYIWKFKWSRDNGSIVASVTEIPSSNQLKVEYLGRDQKSKFQVGDWVEVLDDAIEFDGVAGVIAKVSHVNEAERILTLDREIDQTFSMGATNPDRHTRVRRWDQKQNVDGNGLLDVVLGHPIELEDGIQVTFSRSTGGDFKVGDYWVFAARTANHSVEELTKAPPRGIFYHYARLALITQTQENYQNPTVSDCRTLYPPADCCTITVRPGEDIQAAINKINQKGMETGGCICLAPGIHKIRNPLVIDNKWNLTITGKGPASKLVFEPFKAKQNMALLYVVGESHHIQIQNLFIHTDSLAYLIVIDDNSNNVQIEESILVNSCLFNSPAASGRGMEQPLLPRLLSEDVGFCIVLGTCCQIAVKNSTLVCQKGLIQAAPCQLNRIRQAISALRLASSPANVEQITTLQGLILSNNVIYDVMNGVSLEDVLEGSVINNQFKEIPSTKLRVFKRREFAEYQESGNAIREHAEVGKSAATITAVQQAQKIQVPDVIVEKPDFSGIDQRYEPTGQALGNIPHQEGVWNLPKEIKTDFYGQLDQELVSLSTSPSLPPANEANPPFYACLIEDYEIAGNQFYSIWGIVVDWARSIRVMNNTIHGTHKVNFNGIQISYGFNVEITSNIIEAIVSAGEIDPEKTLEDYLRNKFNLGPLGIGLKFICGSKINDNAINSPSGIGVYENTTIGDVKKAGLYQQSLLRLLRIKRPWRVFVDLAWVIRAIAPTLSTKLKLSDEKAEFEQTLFQGLINVLTNLLPNIVSKVEVSNNQLQVDRFGICFNQIFTIGGLRILGNRISGFKKAGILVHPWFSVGFVKQYAQWLYWLLEWVNVALTMLRDQLKRRESPKQPTEIPQGNAVAIITVVVSWLVYFCSNYCTREPSTGEPATSAPTELETALDDLLNNWDLSWVDDLLNQSYVIDGNTLRGSGDGIWVGIDGAHITHNHVTIEPSSPVPVEGLNFCAQLCAKSENDFLGRLGLDLDRDTIFLVALCLLLINNLLINNQPNVDNALIDVDKALIDTLPGLRGYGIALMGADMVCSQNQVLGSRSLRVYPAQKVIQPSQPFTQVFAAKERQKERQGEEILLQKKSPSYPPAIGGIWQFSNLISLIADSYLVIPEAPSHFEWKVVVPLLEAVAAWYILIKVPDRSLTIASNTVEAALTHGIRTLSVLGLNEVEIFDNSVKDAVRFGIYHQNLQLLSADQYFKSIFGEQNRLYRRDQDRYVKVHRNTVLRSEQVYFETYFEEIILNIGTYIQPLNNSNSLFVAPEKLPSGINFFYALIWIENQTGTILMSQNHGDGNKLNNGIAVYVNAIKLGIIGNHIFSHKPSVRYAFVIDASSNVLSIPIVTPDDHLLKGLFTNNLTDQESILYCYNMPPIEAFIHTLNLDNL